MQNRLDMRLRSVGVGGLALVSGTVASAVGGLTVGIALAVVGVTATLMALIAHRPAASVVATAPAPGPHSRRSVRHVRSAPDVANQGSARAAEVKRHLL